MPPAAIHRINELAMFGKSKKPSAEDMMAEFLAQKEKASAAAPSEIQQLETKFAALWQLLQEKLDLSEQDLEDCIERIKTAEEQYAQSEAAKGIDDVVAAPEKCPNCGRTVTAATGVCLYCGKQ